MSSTTLTKTSSKTPINPILYQIVHRTQGRVRLRVSDSIRNPDYTSRLKYFIGAFPFVTEVWIKPQALSVVVRYQSDRISNDGLQEQLAIAFQRAEIPTTVPHSTKALAERLGVAFQSLTWHRSQPDFSEWSRNRDPEGIGWNYDALAKTFQPGVSSDDRIIESPLKGRQLLWEVKSAASVKASAMFGKLAGEALGLILLGTTGMVVGAEVGAVVGEAIGAELASML